MGILILVYGNERVSFDGGVGMASASHLVFILSIIGVLFYFLGLYFLSAILGLVSGLLFLLSSYKNDKLFILIMIVLATLIRIFYFDDLTFSSFGISHAFAIAIINIAFIAFGILFMIFSGTVGFILSKFRKDD